MSDTEKITINLGVVDLGKIDLLVEQGFFTNRTDFIRAAIRNYLDKHDTELQETITRNNFAVGIMVFTSNGLKKRLDKGEMLDILVVGMLVLSEDITPELARSTINSIKVLGIFEAPKEVKEAIADRIR
ncbi:MAG TPA: CopG family transcriptional regulator [Chloroflexi bacterium]|nr:CopG family transcriptional regulator [Chloroflexota bacterium]